MDFKNCIVSLRSVTPLAISDFVCSLLVDPVKFPSGRRVTPGKLLAEGGFSFVYSATENGTGSQVALKKLICQDDESKEAAAAEAAIHDRFSHKNLLPLIEKATQKHPQNSRWEIFWFVFPLCSGSLRDEVTRRVLLEPPKGGQGSKPSQVVACFHGILLGLQQMHRQSISHRDIKPENVLLQRDNSDPESFGLPLLMDFGSCGETERTIRGRRDAVTETENASRLCTMQYRAPELFDVPSDIGVLSYAAADMWSMGCSLYCCLLGYSPFEVEYDLHDPCRPHQVDCGHCRTLGPVPWPREGPRSNIPQSLKDLICWILTTDPKKRPGIEEVLERLSNINLNH